MPTHNGITIALQSQYDALTIPEYSSAAAVLAPNDGEEEASETIYPTDRSLIEAYIPVYPSSQFWFMYQCYFGEVEVPFFYFKLFIGGKCFLSWGVGEEDDWRGKTMFGLFGGGTDFEGRRVVERQGFFFAGRSDNETPYPCAADESFEVRVFRSKARRRERNVQGAFDKPKGDGGLSVASVGRVKKGEPRRLYTYALIDPVDEPYAVFRYHLCRNSARSSICRSPRRSAEDGDLEGEQAMPLSSVLTRRLSVPPTMQLLPSTSTLQPWSPKKRAGFSLASTRKDQSEKFDQCPDDESRSRVNNERFPVTPPALASWQETTNTKGGGDLERRTTPPSARRNDGSMSMLRGVLASAMTRKKDGNKSSDSLL